MVFGFDRGGRPRPCTQWCEQVERFLRLLGQAITPSESERQSQFVEIAKHCTCSSGAAARRGLRGFRRENLRRERREQCPERRQCADSVERAPTLGVAIP